LIFLFPLEEGPFFPAQFPSVSFFDITLLRLSGSSFCPPGPIPVTDISPSFFFSLLGQERSLPEDCIRSVFSFFLNAGSAAWLRALLVGLESPTCPPETAPSFPFPRDSLLEIPFFRFSLPGHCGTDCAHAPIPGTPFIFHSESELRTLCTAKASSPEVLNPLEGAAEPFFLSFPAHRFFPETWNLKASQVNLEIEKILPYRILF